MARYHCPGASPVFSRRFAASTRPAVKLRCNDAIAAASCSSFACTTHLSARLLFSPQSNCRSASAQGNQLFQTSPILPLQPSSAASRSSISSTASGGRARPNLVGKSPTLASTIPRSPLPRPTVVTAPEIVHRTAPVLPALPAAPSESGRTSDSYKSACHSSPRCKLLVITQPRASRPQAERPRRPLTLPDRSPCLQSPEVSHPQTSLLSRLQLLQLSVRARTRQIFSNAIGIQPAKRATTPLLAPDRTTQRLSLRMHQRNLRCKLRRTPTVLPS